MGRISSSLSWYPQSSCCICRSFLASKIRSFLRLWTTLYLALFSGHRFPRSQNTPKTHNQWPSKMVVPKRGASWACQMKLRERSLDQACPGGVCMYMCIKDEFKWWKKTDHNSLWETKIMGSRASRHFAWWWHQLMHPLCVWGMDIT